MLHHISLPVRNIETSASMYDAALPALGYRRVYVGKAFVGYGVEDGEDRFAIKQSEETASAGPQFHLAFSAPSRESVDAFYHAALSHGGTDNGPPGLRPDYGANYYAAFIIDCDGHHIEAVHNEPTDDSHCAP